MKQQLKSFLHSFKIPFLSVAKTAGLILSNFKTPASIKASDLKVTIQDGEMKETIAILIGVG